MPGESKESAWLGVYAVNASAKLDPVHHYQGGDYGLEDIVELFRLGRLDAGSAGTTVVVLTRKDLQQLELMAHAHSFDYQEPFIEMCLELARFAASRAGESFRFVSNF